VTGATRYWIGKVLALPVILVVSSLLIFAAVRLLPGDPARLMAGMQADQQVVNTVRARMGLDRPLALQYAMFLRGVLRGDLGISTRSHQPVAREIAQRFPYTLALTSVSYVFAMLFGICAGIVAAIYGGRVVDHVVMIGAISGASVANYWLALMAMDLFAVQLGWVPLLGAASWKSYILPAVTLGLMPAAVIARMCRAGMLEILQQDYIRTARAKGVRPGRIYVRHALRNALIPIVTIAGMNFGALLGGAVITETVFNWPGIGRLMIDAVRYRDYPTIEGITLLTVAMVTSINLAVDAVIGILDPRIRFD
jgi:glutathione transport system permease protein